MSYNLIDLRLYEKVDAGAESHYHAQFATYHEYEITNIQGSDGFAVEFELVHQVPEQRNPKYAEMVVGTKCRLNYMKLYISDPVQKLADGLDTLLYTYYTVRRDGDTIRLTAKHKGQVPTLSTPEIWITSRDGISFDFGTSCQGHNTDIFIPKHKKNVVHIPRTTMGENYVCPKVGDWIYLIDSTDDWSRDWTFIRQIVEVNENAHCTCDVLTLDQDIDRIPGGHHRIEGLGLKKPVPGTNSYTASFDKVSIWRRRDNFQQILNNDANRTETCVRQIGNYADMKVHADLIRKSIWDQPMQFFGTHFHWSDYRQHLGHIYEQFGEYLCDNLFVLKSNQKRPDYLVHIDYHHEQPETPVVGSLTWPLWNCNSNSITVWYDVLQDGNPIYEYGREDVVIQDQGLELREIDRYQFNTEAWNSVILRHDYWHTVYNNTNVDEDRMLLQWRFRPGLSWEEIMEITKEIHV